MLLALRPSGAAYRRYVRAALPVAGILVVLSALRLGLRWDDPANRWAALAVLVVLVPFVVAAADYLRHARLDLTATTLTYVGWFRRRRAVPLTDVVRVVWTSRYATGGSVRPPAAFLVVLGRDGRRSFALNEGFWDVDDLGRLAAALGVTDRYESVTPKQLARDVPGAVPWAVRHPVATAFGIVAVLLVVIVVIAVVVATAQSA